MSFIIFDPNKKEYVVNRKPFAVGLTVGTYYYNTTMNEWYLVVRMSINLYTAVRILDLTIIPKEYLLKALLLS
jgi:hypothetical protein